ncbi:MAG TPA: hypothetical protein VKQ71_09665 [Acidimicrobiales bacterium]|nr:hypothetical protein [Acidimicrobiales bacterium]
METLSAVRYRLDKLVEARSGQAFTSLEQLEYVVLTDLETRLLSR